MMAHSLPEVFSSLDSACPRSSTGRIQESVRVRCVLVFRPIALTTRFSFSHSSRRTRPFFRPTLWKKTSAGTEASALSNPGISS
ncbi:MAG: hypothetical protein BWX67_01889 [Thermotogae bacterium ADurb.Bin062]|nr:MAG: hypothetical protein BWX67_01889 [Thermotogota bacterium ADurb.Bin062]